MYTVRKSKIYANDFMIINPCSFIYLKYMLLTLIRNRIVILPVLAS